MQCDLIDRDCAWWFCGNLEHVKKVLIKKKEAAEKKTVAPKQGKPLSQR